MARMLSNGRLTQFVMTISLSLVLALGTNISVVNAANQSSEDKTAFASYSQTSSDQAGGVNAEGEGAGKLLANADTGKPKTVTGVEVKVVSTNQIDLSWDEVSDATSYKIFRTTKSGEKDYTRVGTSETNSFSNKGLQANKTYYYEVCAVNEAGDGHWSNQVIGVTKVPVKVTKLSIEVASDSQLDLSWKDVNGALSYVIYRSSISKSNGYTRIGTSETTDYSDTDVQADTTYYYKVSAVNGVGEGGLPTAVTAETKVPGVVSNLHVKVIDDDQLDLSWKTVSGASSYNIYRSNRSSGDYEPIGTTTTIGDSKTTSYRSKGLKDNTMYYYQVSAVNGVGEGALSKPASGRTK